MTAVVNNVSERWSGQGTASWAERDQDGVVGAHYPMGRVPTVGILAAMTLYEERDTESGSRALTNRTPQAKDLTGEFTLESFTPTHLARRYYGEAAVNDGGSVTAEVVKNFVSGALAYTQNRKITSNAGVTTLILTDSAGTPATLNGTHYKLLDPDFGEISVVSATGLTLPIKAAYTYGETVRTGILTDKSMREFELCIKMLNTYTNSKLMITLYRTQIEASGMNELIQEKGVESGKLKFVCMEDPTKPLDAVLGRFGFIEHIT